jgi:hypothetical protein
MANVMKLEGKTGEFEVTSFFISLIGDSIDRSAMKSKSFSHRVVFYVFPLLLWAASSFGAVY